MDTSTSSLLERLGGPPAVAAVVDRFYEKMLDDEQLIGFFEGADVDGLIRHQNRFMTFAFSEFPQGFDVPNLLLKRHERLFKMGLNEHHFDMLVRHLSDSLTELGVQRALVTEAVAVVGKLRKVFEEGAKLYKEGCSGRDDTMQEDLAS